KARWSVHLVTRIYTLSEDRHGRRKHCTTDRCSPRALQKPGVAQGSYSGCPLQPSIPVFPDQRLFRRATCPLACVQNDTQNLLLPSEPECACHANSPAA